MSSLAKDKQRALHQINIDKKGSHVKSYKCKDSKRNERGAQKHMQWQTGKGNKKSKSNWKSVVFWLLAIVGTFSLLGNFIYSVQKEENKVQSISAR